MSPANIESALKGSRAADRAGDRDRRWAAYNTALVVLDADFAPAFAGRHGLAGRSFDQLAGEEAVRAAVQAEIDRGKAQLARIEQVKEFTILPGDWARGAVYPVQLGRVLLCDRRALELHRQRHLVTARTPSGPRSTSKSA